MMPLSSNHMPQHGNVPPSLKTSKFKLSTLRATGILLWEGPESESGYLFNDVSNTPHEGVSQRHSGIRRPKDQTDNVGGIAPMGSLSGAAYKVKMSKWFSPDLAGKMLEAIAANRCGICKVSRKRLPDRLVKL